jgi:hypothetical protein
MSSVPQDPTVNLQLHLVPLELESGPVGAAVVVGAAHAQTNERICGHI